MAFSIPLPGLPIDEFLKGISQGGALYTRMMQPAIARQEMMQKQKQFEEELAIRKQQMGQAHALDGLRKMLLEQQLLSAKNANDPNHGITQFLNLQNTLMGGAQGQNTAASTAQTAPTDLLGQGLGAFTPEGMANAQQGDTTTASAGNFGGLNSDAIRNIILRAGAKKFLGVDIGAETPEEKNLRDLQNKIALENVKTQNKNQEDENKRLLGIKNDLPKLESTLASVNELQEIAKNNPDIFGHSFFPELSAKTMTNKNFGRWQTLLAELVPGLEKNFSDRGNMLALKTALQFKPSHAEQQNVALGKLEEMAKKLQGQIGQARQSLGQSPFKDDDLVSVQTPDGIKTMTFAQAKKLGAE